MCAQLERSRLEVDYQAKLHAAFAEKVRDTRTCGVQVTGPE